MSARHSGRFLIVERYVDKTRLKRTMRPTVVSSPRSGDASTLADRYGTRRSHEPTHRYFVALADSIISIASDPITETELAADFGADYAIDDSDLFWISVDGDLVDAEWANPDVRRRFFASLRATGCGRRMIDRTAYFIFADGSFITADRCGIEQ